MGFITFKKTCLLSIIILLTIYYTSAFRLIHTHTQSEDKETKKERLTDIKEQIKSKVSAIQKDDEPIIKKTIEKETKTKQITPEKQVKTILPTLRQEKPKIKILSKPKIEEPKIVKETKKSEPLKVSTKPEIKTKEVPNTEIKTKEIPKPETKTKEVPKLDTKTKDVPKPDTKTKEVPKPETKDVKTKEVPKPVPKKEEKQTKQKIPEKKTVEKKVPEPTKMKEEKKPEIITAKKSGTQSQPDPYAKLLYYNFPTFAPNFEILENEECKKHGKLLIEQLHDRKLWALKMFDSTAKIPSGILKGNLNQFGDFDQCVSIFAKLPDGENLDHEVKIAGKYCLAYIDFEADTQSMKLPVHLAQGRALIRSKNQDPGHFIPRFTTIRWGMCIPSGCTAEDVEKVLENSIKLYNDSTVVNLNFDVSVDSDQCYVRKSARKVTDYSITTLITIFLTILLVLIVFIASIRDLKLTQTEETHNEESSKIEKVFMSFSLKRTTSELLRKDTDSDEIKCIHGIRTICTFILYVAHKLIPIGHLPFYNKTTLTEIANNPISIILRLSVIYTDSFLLLSGILTSYRMSKDIEEKGRIPWFNRLVARYIRLTPSLLVVLLYYAYVMELLGDGPLWNTIVTPNAKICKDYWWRNLFYIQNIYPFQDMCATHTHQLALDMQLSLIAPILVWFLYKKPLFGVFLTLLLHSVSVILRYYTTMNYRLSLVIYHGISLSQLYRTANFLYASSIHRATPYLAGIGLGVLLRQIKPNFSMPKVLSILGWLTTGYFAGWALYSPSHLSSRTYQYDINEAAQFSALCSLAWALALSWIIFSCFADNKSFINCFLSSRPMILLSKISYTLYLTQFIVFFYNVGTVRTSTEFKITTSLDLTELLIVITISILLTILVDMPVQKIKLILLRSSPKRKETEEQHETENKIQMNENQVGHNKQNVEEIEETIEYDEDHELEEREIEEDKSEIIEEDEKSENIDEEILAELESNVRKMPTQLSTESQNSIEELEMEEEPVEDE